MRSRAFLGVLALVSLAGLALAACGDGGEDSVRSELQAARDAINQMIDRAEQGEVGEAEETFEAIHDALHRIDGELRRVDVPQARELSGLVIEIEEELAGERGASRLAELGRQVLRQIERAAETLGLAALSDQ